MNANCQNRLKVLLGVIFMVLGVYSAHLAYNMKNIVHYGEIDTVTQFETGFPQDSPTPIAGAGAGAGGGVDSSNDGVAIGLGIFAGLSMLSSALLLSSLRPVSGIATPAINKGDVGQYGSADTDNEVNRA